MALANCPLMADDEARVYGRSRAVVCKVHDRSGNEFQGRMNLSLRSAGDRVLTLAVLGAGHYREACRDRLKFFGRQEQRECLIMAQSVSLVGDASNLSDLKNRFLIFYTAKATCYPIFLPKN